MPPPPVFEFVDPHLAEDQQKKIVSKYNFLVLLIKSRFSQGGAKILPGEAAPPLARTAERGGRRGHCPGARGHRGTRGSELLGLECKIHQLKLRPAGAMMLFFDFGPKFEHPRTL